jgi:hypothetical protein
LPSRVASRRSLYLVGASAERISINQSIMFKRNLRIVLHILGRHADVLSIHLLLSDRTGPSYVCVVV